MVKLTKSEVLHVAKLANLKLEDEEIERYSKQLENIIEHISVLSEVDTQGVEPTAQVTGLKDVYRKDEIKAQHSLTQDQATSGSDKTYNGYFQVGAILTERSDK